MEFLLGDFFGNLISGKFLGVSKKGLTGLSRVCQVTETYIPVGGGRGVLCQNVVKKTCQIYVKRLCHIAVSSTIHIVYYHIAVYE